MQALHVVFGLFYALLMASAARGVSLHAFEWWRKFFPTVRRGAEPFRAN